MPKIYYIQSGDTLYSIARKLGVTIEHLLEMNQHRDNTDFIYY